MLDRRWLVALIGFEIWALSAGHALLAWSTTFGLLIAASVSVSRHYCLRGVEYTRTLTRERAQVGETIELSTTFGNRKLMPVALLEIEDTLPRHVSLTGGGVSVTRAELLPCLYMARAMRPYEQVTRRVSVRCERRGLQRFGPAYLRAGDYLGMPAQFTTESVLHELLVLPKVVPLALGPVASQLLLGATAARRQLLADPLRTVGAREYCSGDPLRSIDWRNTAKQGTLMVRELEPSSAPSVELVLNVRIEAPHADRIEPDELEFAICVTASLAAHASQRGLPVGLSANTVSRAVPLLLPASSAPSQLAHVLEALAHASSLPNATLAQLLRARSGQRHARTLIVVTEHIDAAAWRELTQLKRKGRSVLVVLIGPVAGVSGIDILHLPYEKGWCERDSLASAS